MNYDELKAALSLQCKIDRLRTRLNDLRQTGGVGTPSNNTPVMGGTGAPAGQIATELDQEIKALESNLVIEKEIIRRYIEKLALEGVERKLMGLRYIDCRSWRLVEMGMGYSRSQTFQLHADILEKIGLDRTPSDSIGLENGLSIG